MVIKTIEIEKFRSFENVSFSLGKRITAISGRNATQKTTVLGMLGQPFTISKNHPMYGCKTIDGYNFRSQFKDKFKISEVHDIIGEHKWKLDLYRGIHDSDYYSVESIARKEKGRTTTLRFWNAESRARGAGYIQLPVYFLSLSRLFPIGESGKTKEMPSTLSQDELDYYISNYRTILSIHAMGSNPTVSIEKGASSRVFSGVNDDVHDVFTNSAGEGNVSRIILAVLSFKRLQEQYGRDYKGGLLLIDELDATLYGFSQAKLVEYLWKASKDFKIQIVFTTHSPIILRSVNKFQRKERLDKGINLPTNAYDSAIVYLEPTYDVNGRRTVVPKNVLTSSELSTVINDINLAVPANGNKLNVYCEDQLAISFLQYALSNTLQVNIEAFMSFVDINLGWSNYIQLVSKHVPEFINNLIVLDNDVITNPEYKSDKKSIVAESGNILFLPLTVEKSLFMLLKNNDAFIRFSDSFSPVPSFSYDICFNNWPLDAAKYKTDDFKHWYSQAIQALGDQNTLFAFWCNENSSLVENFVDQFVAVFNVLADRQGFDSLPPKNTAQASHQD